MNLKSLLKMFLVTVVFTTSFVSANFEPADKYYYKPAPSSCKKTSRKKKAALVIGGLIATAVAADLGYAHLKKGGYKESFTVSYGKLSFDKAVAFGKQGFEKAKPHLNKAKEFGVKSYAQVKEAVLKFLANFKSSQS